MDKQYLENGPLGPIQKKRLAAKIKKNQEELRGLRKKAKNESEEKKAIISRRNVKYDEDNVAAETSELVFGIKPKITLGGSSNDIGNYENATRSMIQKGLEKIQ